MMFDSLGARLNSSAFPKRKLHKIYFDRNYIISIIAFSFKTVAAGHVETVRYECLFGFNNSGPLFENGRFIDKDQTRDEYIRAITDKIVTELDVGIRVIETVSNKVFAAKWIVFNEPTATEQTCLNQSLLSTTCWDAELSDATMPTCGPCELAHGINGWYDRVKKAIGTQRDPRLTGEDIEWSIFAKDLSVYLQKLKNQNLAQKVDWKKLAYLVRAFMIYALSVKLTELLAKQLDRTYYANVDLMKELIDRYSGYKPAEYSDINFDNIGEKVEALYNALVLENFTDDRPIFDDMTKIEGIRFQTKEMEDDRLYGREEFDEFVAFHYKNYTAQVGTMFGRLVATKKKIVFNPLASDFVDKLIYDVSEAELRRLSSLGLSIGQTIQFPTRRIRNENRRFLWNILADWPPCTRTEGDQVLFTELRYRSTTPLPAITIDQSDLVTSYHEDIKTQVEML